MSRCDLRTVGSRSVSKLTTATKRLLVGRPFRSDRLAHTLLPKRIALPVFASDALSSVAYAPQEIFAVLSVAGWPPTPTRLDRRAGRAGDGRGGAVATGRTCTPIPAAAATTRWSRRTWGRPTAAGGQRAAGRLHPDGGGLHRGRGGEHRVGGRRWSATTRCGSRSASSCWSRR